MSERGTRSRTEKDWMADYLSKKDPVYFPDAPERSEMGFDRHNFWQFTDGGKWGMD
jgi:hypothetical protein